MRSVDCIQFPLKVQPAQEPLVWNISSTQHEIHRDLFRRRVATEHTTTNIDFATFGITNPILARGCIGLLELGILRNPNDLEALLDAYQQSKPANQSNPSLSDIILAVLPQKNTLIVKNVMTNFVISKPNLSQIYAYLMPREISSGFDGLVSRLMSLDNSQSAITFLDTFIKTYISIRQTTVGYVKSSYQKKIDSQKAVERLKAYIDKKLYILAEAYKETFQTEDNEYATDRDSSMLNILVRREFESGHDFLDQIMTCPVEHTIARKTSDREGVVNNVTILENMQTGERLSRHHRLSVDGVVPLWLPTGRQINFYSMYACPYVSHGNHPTAHGQ